jgi:hypothetical protein
MKEKENLIKVGSMLRDINNKIKMNSLQISTSLQNLRK